MIGVLAMLKKLIASVLSATFLCSSVMLDRVIEPKIVRDVSLAEKGGDLTDAKTPEKHKPGQYDLEATNSLGKYITNVSPLNNPNYIAQNTAIDPEGKYEVGNLGFDNLTGQIAASSTQKTNCEIRFTFVNEENNTIATQISQPVNAGDSVLTTAYADISKLPQYYIVQAQLFDSMGNPISNIFKLNKFTKQIQEIIATDIHDFNPEQVVNFDESEKTNFLVLNEKTIKAESSENENALISADYDNNEYVFDKIDDSIKNLKEGDYFYIQPSDDDIIAVTVDNITIDGDKATIKGNSDIDDMFDFVKFEALSDDEKATVNTENADEAISYTDHEGEKEFTYESGKPLNLVYEPNKRKLSKHLETSVEHTFKEKKFSDNVKLGAGLKFGTELDFYKKWGYTSISFTISLEVSLSFSAEFNSEDKDFSNWDKFNIAASIGGFTFPTSVPGVSVYIEPSLVGNVKGEFEIAETIGGKIGFEYDSDDGFEWVHDFLLDDEDTTLKLGGELFIGFKLAPGVKVVSKKVAYAELAFTFGLVISAETELSRREILMKARAKYSSSEKTAIMDTDEDTVHSCDLCISGSVGLKFEVGAEISLLTIDIGEWETSFEKGLSFLDFCFSLPYGFSLKNKKDECPHQKYRVTFDVSILGTEVTLDGLSQNTNGNGIANFYCDNGTYPYSVKFNDKVVKTGYITVDNATYTENVNITVSKNDKDETQVDDVSSNSSTGNRHERMALEEREVLRLSPSVFRSEGTERSMTQAIQLGDNISALVYSDYVYIFGHGDMYDFSSSPFENVSEIKNVIFENTDTDEIIHISVTEDINIIRINKSRDIVTKLYSLCH